MSGGAADETDRWNSSNRFYDIGVVNGPVLGQNGWEDDGSVVRLTTSTDKVGIGTSSPNDQLDVDGAVMIRGDLGNSPHGTGYTSNEELLRFPGSTSDYIISIQDGSGRIQHYWNSTTLSSTNRYLVSSEPAWMWDVGVSTDPYMEFKYASSGTAGNTIGWTTHMAFKSNGNVGIGTTNPGEKLVVSDASKAAISFNRGFASGQIEQNSSGGAFRLQNTTGSNKIQFRTYGDSYFNGGNVGIGTTNPASKLHINNGQLIIQSSAGTGSDATLKFRDSDYGTDRWRIAIDEDQSNKLYFYDDVNNQHRMVIQQDGNVGIGTTSPAGRLHIEGGELIIQSSAGTGSDATLKFRKDSGAAQWRIAVDEDQNDKLYFYDDVNGEFRMVILHDGNVGIGTTNPGSYKLAVKGKVRAEEVVVETGWSDFVFEADYDLMPLPEVEQYIAEHQHLPDMPSAEEVAADGLSLGETQALLLQKIEELTLYVIDLKKENEALKDRVGELER